MLERTEQVGTWGHFGERTEVCHVEEGPTGLCSVWGTPPPSPHETSVHCTLLVIGVLQKANPDFQIGQNRAEADKLHKRYILHTGSSSHLSHSRNNFSFKRL